MDKAHASRGRGENGTAELTATGVGDTLVALFFKLTRGAPASDVRKLVARALAEDASAERLVDLLVLAVQTRATRGMGKGEKDLFYTLLLTLVEVDPKAVEALLALVPHYGYYKDWFALLEAARAAKAFAPAAAKIIALAAAQLRADAAELDAATAEGRTPKLSLLAKWAPREKGHYDKGGLKLPAALAKELYGGANPAAAARRYRLLVSRLNRALGTTEVLMAADAYEEIAFGRVASLCLTRHRKAFLNEKVKGGLRPADEATGNRHPDHAGRVAARVALRAAVGEKGRKGVCGRALGPHELVEKVLSRRCSKCEVELLEAQWASMADGVKDALAAARADADDAATAASAAGGAPLSELRAMSDALPTRTAVDLGKVVPLVDVSGSMTGTPMHAAIGLGLLVAELTSPAFRDRLITFESTPRWVDLGGVVGLASRSRAAAGAEWGGSTDFAAALELILGVAQTAKLRPHEIPDLIVFSDMQFDAANGGGDYYYGDYGRRGRQRSWETALEGVRRRFAEVGVAVCGEPYAAPRVIFWNLRGDTRGYPADAAAPNVQMLSGFSGALLKLVLTGAEVPSPAKEDEKEGKAAGPTPAETVRAALDSADFDAVRVALASLTEGKLAGYEFAPSAIGVLDGEDFELVDEVVGA